MIDIENQLNQNLQKINGLKYNGESLSDTNKISKLPSEVELDGYSYVIQENGNVEKIIWVQDKTVVTNTQTGKTYEVGDIVDYNSGVESYTGQWGILGAENGSLLLMSTKNIGNVRLTGSVDCNSVGGSINLKNACEPYKNETYATKARSVKVEDINRVTGYIEPATKEYTYTMVDGYVKRSDQTSPSSQTTFIHFDGRVLSNGVPISVIDNSYGYYFSSKIPSSGKIYDLLSYGESIYWLDSMYSFCGDGYVRWGFKCVGRGVQSLDNDYLWGSNWGNWYSTRGVRAVISLKPDIQISENVNSEGMYEIN